MVLATIQERMGESLTAVRGVFSNRDIRRVEFAFAGSVIGSYAYLVAVTVYAYHHGGATAVGVFTFARLGVAAVVAPVAASIGDRYPPRAGDARLRPRPPRHRRRARPPPCSPVLRASSSTCWRL